MKEEEGKLLCGTLKWGGSYRDIGYSSPPSAKCGPDMVVHTTHDSFPILSQNSRGDVAAGKQLIMQPPRSVNEKLSCFA